MKEKWNSQIITIVIDKDTDEMNGKRPFEERVFARFDAVDARFDAVDARLNTVDARFDAVDARLNTVDARFDTVNERFDVVDSSIRNLDSRLEKLEVRAYDTKPIWEQAIKEIVDTRRELSKRLDRIDALALETRADLRDAEDRLDKLEPKPHQ